MRTASYWACRLSIQRLLTFEDQLSIKGVEPGRSPRRFVTSSDCKLWTFTTADFCEPDEILARWKCLARRLLMSKRRCVRALERGPRGTKRLHIHAVTPEWWPVELIRKWAEQAGFGRIHVKSIPIEKAYYVAKYAAKQIGKEDVRARSWGCVGFRGTRTSDVSCTINVDNAALQPFPYYPLCDGVVWDCGDTGTFTFQLRAGPIGGPLAFRNMELKPIQAKEVIASVLAGNPCFVGEYRGYAIREIKFQDKRSGAQVTRVTVEHNVEVLGQSRLVVEWLPQGADKSAVKAPAQKADIVLVTINTARRFGGATQYDGTIRPLSQLV